jgi:hypothetical protein
MSVVGGQGGPHGCAGRGPLMTQNGVRQEAGKE